MNRTKLLGLITVSAILALGCSSGGAGGGSGGGSADVTWEVTGSYAATSRLEWTISYAWVDPDGTYQSNSIFEHATSIPWSETKNFEAGTGVSINLIADTDHYNNLTLSIHENGTLKAEHTFDQTIPDDGQPRPSQGLTHVVGE